MSHDIDLHFLVVRFAINSFSHAAFHTSCQHQQSSQAISLKYSYKHLTKDRPAIGVLRPPPIMLHKFHCSFISPLVSIYLNVLYLALDMTVRCFRQVLSCCSGFFVCLLACFFTQGSCWTTEAPGRYTKVNNDDNDDGEDD